MNDNSAPFLLLPFFVAQVDGVWQRALDQLVAHRGRSFKRPESRAVVVVIVFREASVVSFLMPQNLRRM